MSNIRAGFVTEDGKVFATKSEATDYLRTPLVRAALKRLAGGEQNLANFLFDQEDEIMKAFEVGTVARVTKSEKKKLQKSIDAVKAITNTPALRFLQENAAAVVESFRWPSVKRMTDEEKVAATKEMLTKLADEPAANWIIANKDKLIEAYETGKEKRIANPNAMAALEKARAARKEMQANAATAPKLPEQAATV